MSAQAATMRRWLLVGGFLVAAGCALPSRDNPNDPLNAVPSAIRMVRMQRFNCREWEDFVANQQPWLDPAIDSDEYDQIDTYCFERCPGDGSDPGGPDVGVWTPNSCQTSEVLAGVARLHGADVQACDGQSVASFLSDPYEDGTPQRIDELVWAVVDSADTLSVEVPVVPGQSGNGQSGVTALPLVTGAGGGIAGDEALLVTAKVRAATDGGVLLTRDAREVDATRYDVSLTAGDGPRTSVCDLSLHIEPQVALIEDPLGADGYGSHIALGDLDLDKGALAGQERMELATSYRIDPSDCVADLVYRDHTFRQRHWGFDGHPLLTAACGADGGAPPVTIGDLFGGREALVVPEASGASHALATWLADPVSPFALAQGPSIDYADAGAATAPQQLVFVGDLVDDTRGDLALVGADGVFQVCSAPATGGDPTICHVIAPPDCNGAPSTVRSIAPTPYAMPDPSMAVAVQSTAGTCIVQWTRGTLDPQVARIDDFPAVGVDVAVSWTTRAGAPRILAAGWLDPSSSNAVREIDPAAGVAFAYDAYPYVGSYDCSYPLLVTGTAATGLGESVAGAPYVECNGSGSNCTVVATRLLGTPALDLPADQVVQGPASGTIADAGALAFFNTCVTGPAAGSDAFFVTPYALPGSIPRGVGATITSRLDLSRARRLGASSSAGCEAPSTAAIGAPGGSTGGVGHVLLLFSPEDPSFPVCTPHWP